MEAQEPMEHAAEAAADTWRCWLCQNRPWIREAGLVRWASGRAKGRARIESTLVLGGVRDFETTRLISLRTS